MYTKMKPILALIPLLYAFVCLIGGEFILINRVMAVQPLYLLWRKCHYLIQENQAWRHNHYIWCGGYSFIQYSVWRQVQSLHIVPSRASSFKWEYPLLSLRSYSSFLRFLPRLLVTSISPFIFPSIPCFRRQFLRKMWPIQLAFRFRIKYTRT